MIGTSVGAINAAIIAGNPVAERLERLADFWRRVECQQAFGLPDHWLSVAARNMQMVATGLDGLFRPHPPAFLGPKIALGAEKAGSCSVQLLRETLSDLIDFDHLGTSGVRLTVGASSVRTSKIVYFDSRDRVLGLDHVVVSGALPPAFPGVRIDGELYWDGGILSNTPVEAVVADTPCRDALVVTVRLWNPHGAEPATIWDVSNRQKDIRHSSRAVSHIKRQRLLHRPRHVVAEPGKLLPPDAHKDKAVRDLLADGCLTRMHVVRLLTPALPGENHLKDSDFSRDGIRQRREAGYRHTRDTLAKAPWNDPHDPVEGIILHEAQGGERIETPAAR